MSIVLKGCDKCRGDLFMGEDEFDKPVWNCLQCGHEQYEVNMKEDAKPTGKRKYTKGPAFYERYRKKAITDATPLSEKPKEYWQGYRQAVLDGAPK